MLEFRYLLRLLFRSSSLWRYTLHDKSSSGDDSYRSLSPPAVKKTRRSKFGVKLPQNKFILNSVNVFYLLFHGIYFITVSF